MSDYIKRNFTAPQNFDDAFAASRKQIALIDGVMAYWPKMYRSLYEYADSLERKLEVYKKQFPCISPDGALHMSHAWNAGQYQGIPIGACLHLCGTMKPENEQS